MVLDSGTDIDEFRYFYSSSLGIYLTCWVFLFVAGLVLFRPSQKEQNHLHLNLLLFITEG